MKLDVVQILSQTKSGKLSRASTLKALGMKKSQKSWSDLGKAIDDLVEKGVVSKVGGHSISLVNYQRLEGKSMTMESKMDLNKKADEELKTKIREYMIEAVPGLKDQVLYEYAVEHGLSTLHIVFDFDCTLAMRHFFLERYTDEKERQQKANGAANHTFYGVKSAITEPLTTDELASMQDDDQKLFKEHYFGSRIRRETLKDLLTALKRMKNNNYYNPRYRYLDVQLHVASVGLLQDVVVLLHSLDLLGLFTSVFGGTNPYQKKDGHLFQSSSVKMKDLQNADGFFNLDRINRLHQRKPVNNITRKNDYIRSLYLTPYNAEGELAKKPNPNCHVIFVDDDEDNYSFWKDKEDRVSCYSTKRKGEDKAVSCRFYNAKFPMEMEENFSQLCMINFENFAEAKALKPEYN